MLSMKQDTAERLAATAVKGLSVEDAKAVIQAFLSHIKLCLVCDGTGEFTFSSEIEIATMNDPAQLEDRRIAAGTIVKCPKCGGEGTDPEFVSWSCRHGDRSYDCRHYKDGGSGSNKDHVDCGYRITLKLP
jgi:hypothetical protein